MSTALAKTDQQAEVEAAIVAMEPGFAPIRAAVAAGQMRIASSMAALAIEVGARLLQLKSELNVSHGGDRRSGDFKISRVRSWSEAWECSVVRYAGISAKTASRWERLAKGCAEELPALKEAMAGKLPEPGSEAATALLAAVEKVCEGKAITRLLDEWGLVAARPAPQIGGDTGGKGKRAPGEDAACEWWRRWHADLKREAEAKTWAFLPDAERLMLAEDHARLAAEIKQSVKTHGGTAKARRRKNLNPKP